MIEIVFEVLDRPFRLVGPVGKHSRKLYDVNGAEWSEGQLVAWAGERTAHLALAYAHRDFERRAASVLAH